MDAGASGAPSPIATPTSCALFRGSGRRWRSGWCGARDRLPVGEESPEERAARSLGCPVEVYRDAVAALVSLGYNQAAASAATRKVLAEASGGLELDELVRRSLAAATA
jgi:hypothetical protein